MSKNKYVKKQVNKAKWSMFLKLNLIWLTFTCVGIYSGYQNITDIMKTEITKAHELGKADAKNKMYKALPEFIHWLDNNGRC